MAISKGQVTDTIDYACNQVNDLKVTRFSFKNKIPLKNPCTT